MKSKWIIIAAFTLGIALGAFAARKGLASSAYSGKEKKEAGMALLEIAKTQAGSGSWERIAVGRMYYLAGMKSEGQAIFDSVTGKSSENSDLLRIGRVYYEAGEWDKAKQAFDKAIQIAPKDAAVLAEVGAYYNLKGDRAKAEELFNRAFDLESGEVWYTANAAGSYLGVKPQD
jgi:tetratricopeptide (TPR) repeat protein